MIQTPDATLDMPFDRYRFRLRFTRPVHFLHFLHGGAVHGLLCQILRQRELPLGLVPTVPESGRIDYAAGDRYHFGVTLVGEARQESERIEAGLRHLGNAALKSPGATLGGNFELEEVEALPRVDVEREVAELARADGPLEMRFVSPLRLRRPKELVEAGSGFFDAACFPFDTFLDRLWRRLFRTRYGRWATREELAMGMPPAPSSTTATPGVLQWIDLPKNDRSRTLGGVLGRVRLAGMLEAGVPEAWLPILVLGRHLQAGASTHFGFGRYVIGARAADALGPLEEPASRLLERLVEPERLAASLERVARRSKTAGVDGISPSRFRKEREYRLPELASRVQSGRPVASALLGRPVRRAASRRPVPPQTVPTVADRVLQGAAVGLLRGPIDQFLEDGALAYRKGISRCGARKALEHAYRDGFRTVLATNDDAFFDEVRWPRLFEVLDALFPGEPLLDLVRQWVEAPVSLDGMRLVREHGLPRGAPISPLLVTLYLAVLEEDVMGEAFRLVRQAGDLVVLCRDLESAERVRRGVEAVVGVDPGVSSWLLRVSLRWIRAVLVERRAGRRQWVEMVGVRDAA